MFLFDEARDYDPMLCVEQIAACLDQAVIAEAMESCKGWGFNRKTGGLRLMTVGACPIPKRYKFYFSRYTYSRPFRTDEMKKRDATPQGEVAKASVADATFEKRFPRIFEYMTLLHFDDGTARELSKVSLFVENGKFKAALNDHAERCSLYVAADSVDGVLKALEASLGQENPEWRAWNHNTKKK